MDLDARVRALVQTQGMLDGARAGYADHMARVRRSTDPDLIKAHLGAAQRHYDVIVLGRAHVDRLMEV